MIFACLFFTAQILNTYCLQFGIIKINTVANISKSLELLSAKYLGEGRLGQAAHVALGFGKASKMLS